MINFPNISLPWEVTTFLQSDFRGNERLDVLNRIYQLLFSSSQMAPLIERLFSTAVPDREVGQFLKFLGWRHFRDRLSSIYLYYYEHDHYPRGTDPLLVREIVQLEREAEKILIDGQSRFFLFFYYLKLADTNLEKIGQSEQNLFRTFPREILQVLCSNNLKIWYVDWLLLLLWHFCDYLGKDLVLKNLRETIKSGRAGAMEGEGLVEYWFFFDRLSDLQKYQFISNVLAYSYSTNSQRIFKELII
ncbi:MAG: hypothetical protein HQK53_02180 [Oligoflexia bacterium]|nr:hypothetical protein [Oligoflexia bacterium]